MKFIYLLLTCFTLQIAFAQTTGKITIPKGVVYTYASDKINKKAETALIKSISEPSNYDVLGANLMIGPTLWKRFQHIDTLKAIHGNVVFHIDDMEVEGKMSQKIEDSKNIWNEVKKELPDNYIIRKATENELQYYWSTISFDIEEPLFILETEQHHYILQFIKESLKLFWIDEFPNTKSYINGNEVFQLDKGEKETKIEKVILQSSDEVILANSSIEDITSVIDKTNAIFEELFLNSQKSGKIMVQFELTSTKNVIEYAVREDLDLDLMKVFEKRVNEENFPNTKKDSVRFQLIFKVNSYNDTE